MDSKPPEHASWFKHVPNAISAARLVAVPVLAWFAWSGRESAFAALLVAALISDILDGLIARRFQLTSELGAMLDSMADAFLFLVSAYGLWTFHRELLVIHGNAIWLVMGLWALENIVALLRYQRLSSFHTYLARAAAYAMGLFIGSLFVFGFSGLLLGLAVAVAVVASLEEFALLALLPQWRSNVKGLWWVLRERASRTA